MALNNLERLAAQGERVGLPAPRTAHPGAIPLLARLGGTSQFLADTLRRYPTLLPWLLEARTMRQWLADELAADLAASLAAFDRPEARWNVAAPLQVPPAPADRLPRHPRRRRSHRHHRGALPRGRRVPRRGLASGPRERLGRRYGAPLGADGAPTGLAVIGMGKLGGDELNYSSDIDPIFVYGDDGETAGGRIGSHRQRRVLRPGGARHRGDARVGHRGGPRLPRRPAPAPGGPLGRAHPLGRRLPPLLRRPRRAVGAPGPDQGARLRGRPRGGRALPRGGAVIRLPSRHRSGHRGRTCAG